MERGRREDDRRKESRRARSDRIEAVRLVRGAVEERRGEDRDDDEVRGVMCVCVCVRQKDTNVKRVKAKETSHTHYSSQTPTQRRRKKKHRTTVKSLQNSRFTILFFHPPRIDFKHHQPYIPRSTFPLCLVFFPTSFS